MTEESLTKPKLAAIVLTFNEEQHLKRCVESLAGVVDLVLIADCFSNDGTVDLAKSLGAQVVQNEWVNHSVQFNWALTQLPADIDWVLRIDADEYLSEELRREIIHGLAGLADSVNGVYLSRQIVFQGRAIRHGGVYPVHVLRLFRNGKGRCEERWMDEHIVVDGETTRFRGEIVDENLNSLTWWTEKHNRYASREAVELLNIELGFMSRQAMLNVESKSQTGMKRWVKEKLYTRLPGGFRAFAYFVYRYIFRLGFLDGRSGTMFHFLQGFWYRYLVDAKVLEVKRHMRLSHVDVETAIRRVLDVNL